MINRKIFCKSGPRCSVSQWLAFLLANSRVLFTKVHTVVFVRKLCIYKFTHARLFTKLTYMWKIVNPCVNIWIVCAAIRTTVAVVVGLLKELIYMFVCRSRGISGEVDHSLLWLPEMCIICATFLLIITHLTFNEYSGRHSVSQWLTTVRVVSTFSYVLYNCDG